MTMQTMQIRKHAGGLDESVATMKTIPATLEAVKEYMSDKASFMFPPTQKELDSLKVELYDTRQEKRINNWNGPTYIITYAYASTERVPFGFCSKDPNNISEENVKLAPELIRHIEENTPKPKEQKYIESLFEIMSERYDGFRDVINNAVMTLMRHPAFEQWASQPSAFLNTEEQKQAFSEVEYYLDMTRAAFKQVIKDKVLPEYFQKEINQATFGEWKMQMITYSPGNYFICLKKNHQQVALYNGN